MPATAQPETSFSPDELRTIQSLSLAALPAAPSDPTNAVIDDPAAMALGATLFFDMRMSKNGKVACSTCHQIGKDFQDGLPLGKGIGTMNRRTQPLAGVAWQSSFFWDGRKDSLWSQALAPLEKPEEHGLTRTWIAHFMAANFRERYERIFGPLPDLDGLPPDAGPLGSDEQFLAWADDMDAKQREAVNRVFANVGKAIAAFERTLNPPETRFDRFAKALRNGETPDDGARLTDQQIAGLKLFIGRGNCIACHNGPRFTDGRFHNTGVPPRPDVAEDLGAMIGEILASEDEFSCRGIYVDAPATDCAPTVTAARPDWAMAFKTPSLRGVAERPPYMHAGQFQTLDDVLNHYSTAAPAALGMSKLRPLDLDRQDKNALIVFLESISE